MNDVACPTIEVLHRLVESSLAEHESDLIRSHVQNCRTCEQRLDTITDDRGLSLLKNRQSPKIPADDSAFQEQLRQVKKLSFRTSAEAPRPEPENGTTQSIPERIGKYVIERSLGGGAFGQVFAAWDETLQRSVAIKRLRNAHDARFAERFMREAKALGGIRSDHVVEIFEVFRDPDGVPHLVMELVQGGTLQQWRAKQSDLPRRDTIRKAVQYIRDVARGLADVHDAEIIHRDIKPSNILIDARNDAALLTDFGIAHEGTDVTLTADHEILGTPAFMSPEQAAGFKVDHRSDVYSLGASLYQVITGQQLFRGTTHAVVHQVVNLEPTPPSVLNPHVPKDLEIVCLKALEKQAGKRYEDSRSLCEDIQRWLDGKPVAAKPVSNLERVARWCARNPSLAVSLAAVVLSLVVGSVVATTLWIRSERSARALAANRRELRSTLSGFQRRLFSEQSHHWLMAPSFRAETFREFIEYLDEFAAVEWKGDQEAVTAELAADYLHIAESALLLNDLDEAVLAGNRSLQQIDLLSSLPNASPEALRTASQACGVCVQAHVQRCEMKIANEFADRAMECARRGIALDPDDAHAELEVLKAQFYVAQCSGTSSVSSISQIYEDLITLPEIYKGSGHTTFVADGEIRVPAHYPLRNVTYPTTIRVGWFLASQSDDSKAIEILQRNDLFADMLRESMRTLAKPLFECDYFKGTNQSKLALAWEEAGNREKAIESAEVAIQRFERALKNCPFNPTWRLKLAELQLQMSDWMLEANQLENAEKLISNCVDNVAQPLRNDLRNERLRVLVIQCLAKKAALSERMRKHDQAAREYYTAAQDCRRIVGADQSKYQQQIFEARLWLVSRVVEHLRHVPKESAAHNIIGFESNYVKQLLQLQPHLDSSKLQSVIEGELQTDQHELFQAPVSFDDFLIR